MRKVSKLVKMFALYNINIFFISKKQSTLSGMVKKEFFLLYRKLKIVKPFQAKIKVKPG